MTLSIDDILVEPLQVRLRQLEEDHVHYEASFRGPHNSFLQSHFTVGDNYMVKPRPRPQTVDPSFVDNKTGLVSTSSMDSATSTDSQGTPVVRSNKDLLPDFTVYKMSEAPDRDIPVLIWELKRGKAGDAGANRARAYGFWLEEHEATVRRPSDLPPISVFLVEKSDVTQYRVKGGQVVGWEDYASVLDPKLHEELRALAGTNWRVYGAS